MGVITLEDIRPGVRICGIAGNRPVTAVAVEWHGNMSLTLTYRTESGALGEKMLFRPDEERLSLERSSLWTFDAPADDLKLASEAYRIHLAHLFDPYLAIRTSAIDPLPHQISAVYKDMLPKMPLRFVLADDPGAGKTIMCGLLIKEMLTRGDLRRCLIVCPGNLAEQWQDELYRKFSLTFTILTNDLLEAAATRNAFIEHNLCIARLDKLARNVDVQALLKETSWDLIVCDEAHKLSATIFGGEVKSTKRYQLGQLLGQITENFLLLTATPHNGKPEDFQLFMSLIDRDRFEGARHMKSRSTSELELDVSDVMRRLVKEELLRFDGRPLFPERIASTVTYTLSPAEAELYDAVTQYVTSEFNRADQLDGKLKNSVGFALTILQRRLASSPEAIYQSLRRRRERLEARLLEMGDKVRNTTYLIDEDFDEDDYTSQELENLEDTVIDSASAAATTAELEAEIATLKTLEYRANEVRKSGHDRKWDELSRLLQENASMFAEDGRREKLIIFTEHKDTLEYLATQIRQLLGNHEAVITIKGGMSRDERHRAEESFKQDSVVRVLVATDAAGEGINLQRAHLMVNYDLPWNPNRIEQRFGRIHRIGQTEVCHLWNLVAKETREGEVFNRLFSKLEEERKALGGRVFDILGRVTFEDRPLRELLVKAIRYGDRPDVRNRLNQVVDSSLDGNAIERLLQEYALTTDVMDIHQVVHIKEDMERMEARKLEPHFIEAFFCEAMRKLGGRIVEREPGRYEVPEVPFSVRTRDARLGMGSPVLRSYERICFEKDRCLIVGGTPADLVCPGHPLLDALVSEILTQGLGTLKQGSVLVDDESTSDAPRLLVYIESSIQDGTSTTDGTCKTVSRTLHFVEIDYDGNTVNAGYAPYLDYRAPSESELARIDTLADELGWLEAQPEKIAQDYAIEHILPDHLSSVYTRINSQVEKVRRAVEQRLSAEIQYWDGRAWELKDQERAGKLNARINSEYAEKRAAELAERLEHRRNLLDLQKQLSPAPPRVIGGALVIPASLLNECNSNKTINTNPSADAEARRAVELHAMDTVMAIERDLGNTPQDVSAQRKIGYDIESAVSNAARTGNEPLLRLIEVKGRAPGANTVTLSKNEILSALNHPDGWLLAVVEVDWPHTHTVYLRKPELRAPAFTENSVTYDLTRLRTSAGVVLERTDTWQ